MDIITVNDITKAAIQYAQYNISIVEFESLVHRYGKQKYDDGHSDADDEHWCDEN